MLERLVAWVLNTYIGEYVENLNTYQLTVGLFQGQVELENLPLKRDALKKLDLPIEVKSGFIGKVQLKVPVTRLKSEQWVITLDKLYLVAGPQSTSNLQNDRDVLKQVRKDAKKAQLKALEENWLTQKNLIDKSSPPNKTYSWLSYGTSLVTNIVENLVLQINDIHIRYEDDVTIPGCPFSCGLTIDSISAQSADSKWLPRFVSCSDGTTMNKLLDIRGLSIYWDTNPSMAGVCSVEELTHFFQTLSAEKNASISNSVHDYILEPVSAQAKLSRHRSPIPLKSVEQPRFCIELSLDALPLQLSDLQFRGMVAIGAEVKRHGLRQRYLQWRPTCVIHGNERTWWKFAIEAHMHHIHKRNSQTRWKFLLSRAQDNVRYVSAYRNYLTGGSRSLSGIQKDHIAVMEENMTFDELRVLREVVYDQLLREHRQVIDETMFSPPDIEENAQTDDNSQRSVSWLQSWFPDWSGWYSSTQQDIDDQPDESSSLMNSTAETNIDGKQIEQDIFDALCDSVDSSSLLYQDVVFARLTLCINNGSFSLRKSGMESQNNKNLEEGRPAGSCLLELECSSITISFESRPRFNSLKFAIWVEDFYLRDKVTVNSTMPVLIQPMNKDMLSQSVSSAIGTDKGQLFKLIYESKPFRMKADYRLVIAVKPLNIIYSPLIMQQLKDLFSFRKFGENISMELDIAAAAARNQFENLKKHTQNEVKQTLDDLLEGRAVAKGSRWLFDFDICAPYIMVPENLTDTNSGVVVVDLGHLRFCNLQPQTSEAPTKQKEPSESDDDDDLFVTPMSTPPSEIEEESSVNEDKTTLCSESINSAVSPSSVFDRFYEVYMLSLCDLQVMVGKVKDNWKVAHIKGTSLLHVVDKFSISLQLERRLIKTYNPRFPKVRLSGNVPSIIIHISEQKISSLLKCIHILSLSSADQSKPINPIRQRYHQTRRHLGAAELLSRSRLSLKSVDCRTIEQAESVLLSANFCVDHLSVEIQSRGRSIAELQVTNVLATCLQKLFETSIGFVLHSLLVVDALQTLGPDYELLVASHQRICLDRQSGIIRDSCPNSPDRVPSPSCQLDSSSANTPTGPVDVSCSLSSSGTFGSKLLRSVLPLIDSEKALIKLSVDFIDLGDCSDESLLCQANVDFDSLDVVANQQTIAELLGFFQSIMPTAVPSGNSPLRPESGGISEQEPSIGSKVRKEVLANFHSLNVLLMRVEKKHSVVRARRVAVVSLSEAKIQASLANEFSVEASLASLQVLDLTPEGSKYQRVIHVGNLQHTVEINGMSDSAFHQPIEAESDAFRLKLDRRLDHSVPVINVFIRVASVRYMHVPSLLSELSMCLTDFHAFFKRLTASLSNTATELAMGLVITKPAEKLSGSLWHVDHLGTSRHDLSVNSEQFLFSPAEHDEECGDNGVLFGGDREASIDCDEVVHLDVVFASPVIMLPRAPNSPDVLLLHLGKIVMYNVASKSIGNGESLDSFDTIVMQIHDVSMSSINLDEQDPFSNSSEDSAGVAILHSTSLELKIKKNWNGNSVALHECFTDVAEHAAFSLPDLNRLMIAGEVLTSVRFVLTKQVFEQILKTLDNITPTDEQQPTSNQHLKSENCPHEKLHSEMTSQDSTPRSRRISERRQAAFVVAGSFCLPSLNIKMVADLADGINDRGLVNLQLDSFTVHVIARQGVKALDVRLHSLVLEDLLIDPCASHRWLMVSRGSSSSKPRPAGIPAVYISQSLPTGNSEAVSTGLPASLPSSLSHGVESQSVRAGLLAKQHEKSAAVGQNGCGSSDSTGNLSSQNPIEINTEDLLVHVKVKLVDRKAPEYVSYYNKTNRFVSVIFNSLETTVNLETWVLLLEFLGVSGKNHNPEDFTQAAQQKMVASQMIEDEIINTDITIDVTRLSLVLNKPEYELASAEVTSVVARISARDCNLDVSGQLGSLTLRDTSPHGTLYRERLYTPCERPIAFSVFKYGLPDPDGLREFDVRVELHIPPMWYVHTHRFLQEIIAYFQNFNQLQDIIGRSRAASDGRTIADRAYHNARVSLDVAASEPMILIPHSSRTKDILVLNLGKLRVQNTFLRDGTEGTLSGMLTKSEEKVDVAVERSLMTQSVYGSLDGDWRSSHDDDGQSKVKSIETEMFNRSVVLTSFYSTLGTDGLSSVASSITQSQPPLFPETKASSSNYLLSYSSVDDDYRCLLDVMNIELFDTEVYSAKMRHLFDTDVQRSDSDLLFPSFIVHREQGDILREKCRLQLQVERNLDVDIVRGTVPDLSINGKLSSVHLFIDTMQYKLIRGVLSHNFGEKLEEFQTQLMSNLKDPKTQSVLSGQATKSLSICLELDGVKVELLLAHSNASSKRDISLAQFDFQHSVLKFESRSDNSKDIDLVSHELLISDTRFRDEPVNVRPNVFSDILKPSADRRDPTALQLELHCRCSGDMDRYKVILNNMRLVSVFDWLLVTKEFLASSFEDPFQKEKDEAEVLALGRSSSPSWYAVNSGSILTKRISASERKETAFELCLNLTESEVVVVENPGNWDTNAIILKGTAILSYSPRSDRILSCSLSSLELFSCSLAAENETALSIIDPMSLSVELNNSCPAHNRRQLLGTPAVGLLDVAAANDVVPVLEISFQMLYVRLSYNDICLFLAIINSVPHQLINARHMAPPKNSSFSSQQLSDLEQMGFLLPDCELALLEAKGDMEQAMVWLTKNARSITQKKEETRYQLYGFEVKCGSVSVCLIDDCQDTDVPLAELMVTDLYVLHRLYPKKEGSCRFEIAAEYYNRLLSGWEPLIEKWDCQVSWNETVHELGKKLVVQALGGDSLLNLNVTSCLLDQVKSTRSKWIAEYSKTQLSTSADKYNSIMYNSRRRVPFIPFALRNKTGCRVKFIAMSKTLAATNRSSDRRRKQSESEWKTVEPDTELPFLIDEYDKLRHKHSSQLKVHQLVIKVDGWKEMLPVSVDKVGVYFRQADADIDNSSKLFQEMPPVRILFEIDIDGTARKMITIRSGVMFNNQLNDAIEVKLVNSSAFVDRECRFCIEPACQVPLPLKFVYSNIWLRPVNWSLDWSKKPMTWQKAMYSGDVVYTENSCSMLSGEPDSYRFCVSAQNLSFSNDPYASSRSWVLPGHVITVSAPFHIESLLPIDLHYTLLVSGSATLTGTIKGGKQTSLVVVDVNQSIEFQVSLENFPQCRSLVIPPGTTDFATKMCLHDTESRPLELIVSIKAGQAGSVHLTIAASFWLVNRSGLPLIFKQDGCTLAAGQFAEHEIARSVTPLLFCFAEKEKYELLTMKLGKSVHGPKTYPQWCQRFMLERGVTVRQIHVSAEESRPDWVYNLGIEVRQGRGRYSETSIVTIKPRYQLVNHSSHKLAYAQRFATLKQGESFLSAPTNSEVSYHWPRVDLDNLLCIRMMDKPTCNWSGGFLIDRVDSFHVNMRGEGNQCLFLRVDIALQGAMFVVEFTDADHMPPPYRIDNFAEISVLFYQTKVSDDRLRTWIKPRTSLPYAWDEPTGLPHITLKVTSGTDAVYDMNTIGEGEKLYYENFIYIAFTHTFQSSTSPALSPLMIGYRSYFESQELVLDVINGRIVIKKKELGRRSQLWRMSTDGMLQHEGSSSPRDPRSRILGSAVSLGSCFVLDIDDIALQPNREVPLTLRKVDERRKSTQIWKFTRGGLFLGQTNLCIQVKDGVFGLRDGGEIVLGQASSPSSLRNSVETTPQTAVERQKSHAGSGVLCVKVINDGPTRVLQISDIALEQYRGTLVDDWMVIDSARKPDLDQTVEPLSNPEIKPVAFDFEFFVRLPNGIGISLIDNTPEELIYATFRGVTLEYISINNDHIARADVHSFQVDNQLFDSCRPVLLCVVPESPQEDVGSRSMPALTVSFHKLPGRKWNAHIFKDLSVLIKPVTLQIEEKLLWKLLLFCGFQTSNSELDNCEEVFVGSQRITPSTSSGLSRRHYFGSIKINVNYISLSMVTSVNLPSDLKKVKHFFGIPLIRFEDAKVELDPFLKHHLFETTDFLAESIQLHYTGELMSQAAKILGSVDFLGNPLGLFSDMAEGVSGLLEGNVSGMLKNLTHGFSNSAAKVVGTLSDGVGMITLDKKHQLQRLQIMNLPNDGGRVDPLRAGFHSFMHGFYGGITSIPQQAFQGARDDGFVGLVSGFSRGVIGAVTKPVAGFLDLTSSAATSLRDTSKGVLHRRPVRHRRPRCCYGNGGLLPPYQESDAEAQEVLLQKNNHDYSEKLLTVKLLRSAEDDTLKLLISSSTLYFVNRGYSVEVLRVPLGKLLDCQTVCRNGKHYVELTVKVDLDSMASSSAEVPRKRPEVRCESQSIAESVTQHIVYAKSLYDEMKLTLRTSVGN